MVAFGSLPDDWGVFLGTPLTRRFHASSLHRTCNPQVTLASESSLTIVISTAQKTKKPRNSAALKIWKLGAGEGIRTLDPNLGKEEIVLLKQ